MPSNVEENQGRNVQFYNELSLDAGHNMEGFELPSGEYPLEQRNEETRRIEENVSEERFGWGYPTEHFIDLQREEQGERRRERPQEAEETLGREFRRTTENFMREIYFRIANNFRNGVIDDRNPNNSPADRENNLSIEEEILKIKKMDDGYNYMR